MKKTCFKCNKEQDISCFYRHPKMTDGVLGKCKDCTKLDAKIREKRLRLNPDFIEKERRRGRDKYFRLKYKDIKPSPESKARNANKYAEKYPEKRKAHNATYRMPKDPGTHNHHWSYNEAHFKDVLNLNSRLHLFLHRYIIYDQSIKLYRDVRSNKVLDSKQSHLDLIDDLLGIHKYLKAS